MNVKKEHREYMVVCRNKKAAHLLCEELIRYLTDERIQLSSWNNGRHACISIDNANNDVSIKFVSERQFYEASRGYHGWFIESHQVEEWLEEARKIKELRNKVPMCC